MFTQSCSSTELYIWNCSGFFSFIVLKFNSIVVAKLACTSPVHLWKQLQDCLLCHLLSAAIPPLSLHPLLPLKWPEFENHLLAGWGVLAVLFQFAVAGTFHSISVLRQLHTPETQPGRTWPAKSVHSEWCASLSLLKPKSPGGKCPAECVKKGMLERLWLSRHLLALRSVLPPPASVVSSCFLSWLLL